MPYLPLFLAYPLQYHHFWGTLIFQDLQRRDPLHLDGLLPVRLTQHLIAKLKSSDLSVKRGKQPKIDIVPLVDVLMVLIIFFLVSMQFQDLRAINIKLPKIETAGSNLIEKKLSSKCRQAEFTTLMGRVLSLRKSGDFWSLLRL